IPLFRSATQQRPATPTQSNDTPTITPSDNTLPERTIDPPNAVSSGPTLSADSNSTSAHRIREPQRRQQARSEPPAPAVEPVDHTCALLMIVFAALAIAGPALHCVERRRRRKAANFQPPPWARVAALNAPTPRMRVMPRQREASPAAPAPAPIRPPDQTERL